MQNIEDILELILDNKITVLDSDKPILLSIARQTKKQISLTDRQYNLVKSKLLAYKDRFEAIGIYHIEICLDILRQPLREVDRSKTITFANPDENPKFSKEKSSKNIWFKLRFPFSKKTIVALEKCVNLCNRHQYLHNKGTHDHYFKYNEKNVDVIVEEFQNKNFYIDPEITRFYNRIQEIKKIDVPSIPTVINNHLINFSSNAIRFMENEIGNISNENLIKYYDRRKRYGINEFNITNPGNLLGEIVFRNSTEISVDPEKYTLNKIVENLIHLDRFPMLVLVDESQALEQVSTVYNALSEVVLNKHQSVLFRLESSTKYNINDFIKDKELNNWVDIDTQIVYINKNKLPKILFKSEWQPICALGMSSHRCHTNVSTYVFDKCDLVIYHDKQNSIFKRNNLYEYL